MQKLDQFYERQQGFDGNDGRKHTNWTLTQPNQQQDLDPDTNSTRWTLKLKYAKAMARKVLGQKKMPLDYRTNAKHSKLGDKYEPAGIP